MIGISSQANFALAKVKVRSTGRRQNPESKECGLHVKHA
jgi:hypothetical protein